MKKWEMMSTKIIEHNVLNQSHVDLIFKREKSECFTEIYHWISQIFFKNLKPEN